LKNDRDKEKAIAGLLARGLRQARPGGQAPEAEASAKVCPEPEVFAAYYDQSLAVSERERWESHFSTCVRCQAQLAALVRSEPEAAKPIRERVIGLGWVWNWRWVAPAAAAAAAVALWIAIRPTPPRVQPPPMQAEQEVAVAPAEPRMGAEAPKELAKSMTSPAAEADRKIRADVAAPKREGLAVRAPGRIRGEANEAEVHSGAKDIPSPPPAQMAARDAAAPGADEMKSREKQELAAAQKEEGQTQMAQRKLAEPGAMAQSAAEPKAGKLADKVEPAPTQTLRAAQEAPLAAPATKQPVDKARDAELEAAAGERRTQRLSLYRENAATRSTATLIVSPEREVLWRLQPGGTIERSSDAGRTWQAQKVPIERTDVELVAGSAPSDTVCWVVGTAGTALRTTDGTRWEKVSSPTQADLASVKARNALEATVTAADGRSYATRDGGKSWQPR